MGDSTLEWYHQEMRKKTVKKYGLLCHSCNGLCNPETHRPIKDDYLGTITYVMALPFAFKTLQILFRFHGAVTINSIKFGFREMLRKPIPAEQLRCFTSFPTHLHWMSGISIPRSHMPFKTPILFPNESVTFETSKAVTDIGMYGEYLEERQ